MLSATLVVRRRAGLSSALFLCCCAVLALAKAASAAGTIVNSNGFESPYALAPLQGQFGWQWAPNNPAAGSSATVQNTVVASGSQALKVVRAGGAPTTDSDARWGVPVSGYPSQRYVIIDWDMRVMQPSNLNGFGPFFGVEAYDDVGTFGRLGSFGVDATTGDVLYGIPDGDGILVESGTVVTLNQWHHFRMVLDFATDTYRGYRNGTLIVNSNFISSGAGFDQFSDADIAAVAAQGDSVSLSLTAEAYFDNFIIRDGLLGDYNVDGVVDNADFTTWRSTLGNAISPAGINADGNKNGVVDAADYVLWRENLGTSLSSGMGAGSALVSVVVPEPASLALLAVLLSAVLGTIRRR